MMRLASITRSVPTLVRASAGIHNLKTNNVVRLTLTHSRTFATKKDNVKEAEYRDIGDLNERENQKGFNPDQVNQQYDAEIRDQEEKLKELDVDFDKMKGLSEEDMAKMEGQFNSAEFKQFEEDFRKGKFGNPKDFAKNMKRGMDGEKTGIMGEELDEDELPEELRNAQPKAQSSKPSKPIVIPTSNEVAIGESEKLDFQAETQKILNIVASSLYTEKEVFIRELISNCSDALEKLRHNQMTGEQKEVVDADLPLEVNIYSDEENKILIIQDSGVGMTKEELISNLGRIGHSGSAEFLKKISGSDVADKGAIIGQFGVGFYSCFMVANKVKVFSKAAAPGSKGYLWESDGSGTYTIREAEGVSRGTKIVIHLKDNAAEFSAPKSVENIIKKYSNFVAVPIKLNGDIVNTIKALWCLPKDKISEEEHKEFYHFIAKAYDTPAYRLHYSTDSPINIRSLLYFPSQHIEKYGMGRMESGVSLFCRKVLIQNKARGIFPEWLRFVKGVVDSEDLSLNISREHLQDSALVQKLSNVLTKRVLKYLDDEAKKDPVKYEKWFEDFGLFLKEGVCTDYKWKEDVAKLIRMDSSHKFEGDLKMTSLDEYLTRMKPGQKEIYYLCVPARDYALSSPYYEAFQDKNYEVLFLYNSIDEFVMTHLNDYKGKKLVSAETAKLDAPEPKANTSSDNGVLSETQITELTNWMRETLSDKVTSVKETKRLSSSPAVIVDHESSSFRKMMKFMDPNRQVELPKQQLEINPKHPIIVKLAHAHKTHPNMAKAVAEQILDNALVAAGLVDDSRSMLPRLNRLLEMTLEVPTDFPTSAPKGK
eukprot:TRINITY_DN3133_c0_g1_i1.p1 TRINITY_DN3133_c0_g1~~TRINITY_DN3133_c0_g1_i1.p1  ORF type:complete len:941 (+),score=292.23 TRINITY_DN3133_c0_g1_i1:359-2824(+)